MFYLETQSREPHDAKQPTKSKEQNSSTKLSLEDCAIRLGAKCRLFMYVQGLFETVLLTKLVA